MSSTSEQPMTLEEALRAFCDPWDVRKLFYLAAKGHSYGSRENKDRQRTSQRDWSIRAARYDELHQRLQATIVAKMVEGSYSATGYDPRLPINASLVSVPNDAWGYLIMNFNDSTVLDGSAVIQGVRIGKPAAQPLQRPTARPKPGARVIIRQASGQVEVDGEHITGHAASLLTLLAREAQSSSRYVTGREIEDHLWGTSIHRIVRPARDVVRDLRDSLAANSEDPAAKRKLVKTKRNLGWRLLLSGSDIEFAHND
jgi:hypothetical protein